jgi:Cd2+/Zn2+-exporting ATPase
MLPTHARPGEALLQLEIPLILPGTEDADDTTVARLADRVSMQAGVTRAHVEGEGPNARLCLHYDPTQVPLARLERLARDEGAQISQRFRHETMRVRGMHCASCAVSVEHVLKRQPGVLRARVSFGAERLKVEYDAQQTSRESIDQVLRSLGYNKGARTSSRSNSDTHPNGAPCAVPLDLAAKNGALQIPLEAVSKPAAESHSHDHRHEEEHDHDHDEHAGDVRFWRNPEVLLSLGCGALTGAAWAGEKYLRLPPNAAVAMYGAAYVAGGWKLARHTFPAIARGRFDVDLLMLLAAVGAAILGEWFEGALLLFLFSLGHALEHFALDRARRSLRSLESIVPRFARVQRGDVETEVPVEELRIGDVVVARPGERLPADGQVLAGHSSLDQSALTGESVPVEAGPGSEVFAGSINGDGALEICVSKLSRDSTMARVVALVEEAQEQKSHVQTFAERFERIFVPTVLIGVFLAAVVPPLVGWLPWPTALLRALSALVAASPCALALATPAAVLAGIGQAARHGVLIKGGAHLEQLGSLASIALDKTGTLTRGRPEVAAIETTSGITQSELLRLAAGAESRSSHPLAQAVVRRAQEENIEIAPASELQTLPGLGVAADVEGGRLLIGNACLLEENRIALSPELAATIDGWSERGWPSMLVARQVLAHGAEASEAPRGGQVLGALALADPLRPEARQVLEQIRGAGVREVVMLTGDNERVAAKIAAEVGLSSWRAGLLPAGKVALIREMAARRKGMSGGVAMVGDGVNDAPALAAASVGIAIGGAGGTDVALETADIALMSGDLSRLPFALEMGRRSRAIVRQNLWIALGMIALLLPTTLLGLAPMSVAVVFHEGSTLVVVFNALRLLAVRPR